MKKITEVVWALAEPAVQAQGCRIWDVEYVREAGSWYLRVFIDKEGGVSINDCENISRTLQYAANQYQIEDILMVGGVCANSVIRSIIIKICNSYFAEPELSRDNAAGIAALGAVLSEGCAKNG